MKKRLLAVMTVLFTFLFVSCSFLTTGMTTTSTTATTATTTVADTTTTTPTTTTTTTSAVPTTTSTSATTTTQTTTSTTTTITTSLTQVTTTLPRYQTIELFSINDMHGGVTYSSIDTLAKIGGLLAYKKQTQDNVILLTAGDMFQGTAFSNYYYGLPIVETMNYALFDAFTLGNHEFDWGIDKIANYADGDETNGEAVFSFLAANIVSKTSGDPLPWTQPYIVIDINGVKVGVIGVIGDVMSSISASRVEDVEFLDAVDTVATYASYLRNNEDCDVIVVSLHDGSGVDAALAALSGDERVDAVFNGHTHRSETGTISRSGTALAYAQVSSYDSSAAAKITLVYDRTLERVTSATPEILSATSLSADEYISQIIAVFATDETYLAFVNQVLGTAEYAFSRDDLAPWGASVIRDYVGLDFGVVNSGGFRVVSGISLDQGPITMGELVASYPFDNYIKTCQMTGAQLTAFYAKVISYDWDVVFDDGVTYVGGVLYKDGVPVGAATYYTVGAVDYIFDKTNYDFLDGIDIETTVYLMRNLLADDLFNHSGVFNPASGTAYPLPVAYAPVYRREGNWIVA
ncbi:MAG: 5'-nucleotidase C-terminal domain-containing protein [bacterium]